MQTYIDGEKHIPILLWDGDCGFCTYFVKRWREKTGDTVFYKPYQQALSLYPQLTEKECKEAVQLVMPDGKIFSGAHAVFVLFHVARHGRVLHWAYDHVPLFGRFSEFCYQLVSHHRMSLSRLFFGTIKKCG
jgi:predicted DCC family thiol-disulfide oxidoreductase YuxK